MAKKTTKATRKTTPAKLEIVKNGTEKNVAKIAATTQKVASCFAAPFLTTPLTTLLEENMTKNTAQFDKFTKDATAAGREGFEAFTKSYSIFQKGCENIIRTSVEISQTVAEKQAAYAKEALSCKTINEFAEVQSKIAQSNFDDFMSNMTKLSEISTKILTESAEPLNEQINKAVQKMSEAA